MTDTLTLEAGSREFHVDTVIAPYSGLIDGTDPEQRSAVAKMASFLFGVHITESDVGNYLPSIETALRDQHPELATKATSSLTPQLSRTGAESILGSVASGFGESSLPLTPVISSENLSDFRRAHARREARHALDDVAMSYIQVVNSADGGFITAPSTYQIGEPGFRPFKQGKAASGELKRELDGIVEAANQMGVDLGIESRDSLKKLLIQMGLGVDCSNFAYRAMSRIHERLDLKPYNESIFKDSALVLELYESGRWKPVNSEGADRELTYEERDHLSTNENVSIAWVASVFGKDPEHITGSGSIGAGNITQPVGKEDLSAGDLIVFTRPDSQKVVHVAVVAGTHQRTEYINNRLGLDIAFWHSWHSRDIEAGLRNDTIHYDGGGNIIGASHPGLINPDRYDMSYLRPNALAEHYSSL